MVLTNLLTPSSSAEKRIVYGSILSICYSVLFIILSYLLFYLRYNVSERVERVSGLNGLSSAEAAEAAGELGQVNGASLGGRHTDGGYGRDGRARYCRRDVWWRCSQESE